jgi:molybdopterin synthase catalytic subunit
LIRVTEDELSEREATAAVLDALQGGAGAVVTFTGTVRNSALGHRISYLEYHAYKPMAERELARVSEEVKQRWGWPCAILHRTGHLTIGEASVVVAVAAPHRRQAFEACEYAIDRVKETVPVWKKEVAQDGFWWVEDPLAVIPSPSVSHGDGGPEPTGSDL